ncbi:MAG TPA: rod shape-determining protein RodA [Gemmatimonadales bacterium]|nr:rod shape-determining protein RodA [Gemmatimonadales bacterium]
MASRGLDSRTLLTVGALVALGLATLYSAGQTDVPTDIADIWQKQLGWIVLATAIGAAVYRVSPRLLEWATPFVYGLAVVLLILTLVVGTGAGTAAGTKSWLAIGGTRVGQPAELAKLATIMMLARHLGGRRRAPQTLVELLPAGMIVGLPFLLVGLQPDLGSAIVFLAILFVVLFWVGVPIRLLVLLASPLISLMLAFSTWSWGLWIVAITLVLLWARPYVIEGLVVWLGNVLMGTIALQLWRGLAPYQQNRLLSFLNPEIDPRATGWNIIQSKVAIGSGGLLGKGFLEGTQKALAFLPAQHTDFIFSVLAEELGFLGVMVTLGLFAALLMQLMQIARSATDPFSSVLVFGICGLLFTHVVENVGMSVGLMPITGIPLPFFSYGGSFLLISFVAVAMCLRVARESRSSYTRT